MFMLIFFVILDEVHHSTFAYLDMKDITIVAMVGCGGKEVTVISSPYFPEQLIGE